MVCLNNCASCAKAELVVSRPVLTHVCTPVSERNPAPHSVREGLSFRQGEQCLAAPLVLETEPVIRGRGPRRCCAPCGEDVTESRAGKRNVTIAEAADLAGLSRKAMARRVERGSIRSVLRSGRRLIPRSELVRVGLLPAAGESTAEDVVESVVSQSFAISENPDSERSLLEVLVRELLDRVQRQAGELAHYRALTAEAATLRMEREVADLRLRLVALEGHGSEQPLALDPSDSPQPHTQPPIAEAQQAVLSDEGLWLPPRTAAAHRAPLGSETPGSPLPRARSVGRVSISRILIFVAEMLFIGLAALLAWLAGLGPVLAATVVGVAWVIAAAFELVRWRDSNANP
jgi:hypothetical protein